MASEMGEPHFGSYLILIHFHLNSNHVATILDSAELSEACPSTLTSGCPASRRNGRVGPLLCPPAPRQMRSAVNDCTKLKANEMPSVRVANSFQKSGEQATLAIYQTLVTTWAWFFHLVIIICFNMYKKIIIRS